MDPKHRRELETRKNNALTGFVDSLRYLINAAYAKNTKDSDFEWYKNAYAVAATTNPEEIIRKAGPPLWDHREEIESRDANYFLKSDFVDDFAKHRDKGIPDEMDHERVLIRKIKLVWHLFSESERSKIGDKFNDAVTHLAVYMKSLREERDYD